MWRAVVAICSVIVCVSMMAVLVWMVFFKEHVEEVAILMPAVRPDKPDVYLCTAYKLNATEERYIVGYEPNADMDTVHHILMFGCDAPAVTSESWWDCGTRGTCDTYGEILYAWARNAPELDMPSDVGFRVGGKSPAQYMVMQVHYNSVDNFKDGRTDSSGIIVHFSEEPVEKLAGVIILGTTGVIPPMTTEHMEVACGVNTRNIIHPFAFRTHSHSLGRVIAGYKVSNNTTGKYDQWTLIGKKDPQLPQMFYPVTNDMTITRGDMLAARCTMVSNRTTITVSGGSHMNEMCNFYIMYYVDPGQTPEPEGCWSEGPPGYYWRTDHHLDNIPDTDASTLD